MVLYKSDFFSVGLPDGKNWIYVDCKAMPDLEDFKTGLMKALEYVKQHHVNAWLFDLRAIDALSEEEETWCQVQFFPQLMMLGQENYIALVVSEVCYNRMVQEVGAYGLKSYNSFIIIDTFNSMGDAELWLRSHQVDSVS